MFMIMPMLCVFAIWILLVLFGSCVDYVCLQCLGYDEQGGYQERQAPDCETSFGQGK